MTRPINEAEAERLLFHIISSQPNLFKEQTPGATSAQHIALFCATFIHQYSEHLSAIGNKSFKPKANTIYDNL